MSIGLNMVEKQTAKKEMDLEIKSDGWGLWPCGLYLGQAIGL